MIDPTSGIRTEIPQDHEYNTDAMVKPHREPMASTMDYPDQCILEVDGNKETETCDHLKPCTGADVLDVRRLFLAEVRVAVFHIQAYAWQNAYQEACTHWLNFLSSAIAHSADFITGDGNLFAQRNFKPDSHSDFKSCILVDLLERLLDQINSNRTQVNMILISLCYGKQHQIVEDRAKKAKDVTSDTGMFSGPSFEPEILLADFEHPKHLTVYDLGLADADKAWHSPLYVLCTIRCIKNLRIRNLESENRRRGRLEARNRRWEEEREDRREIRRERDDSVGPLPGEPAPETVYRYSSRERAHSRARTPSREPAYTRRRRDDYDDDYDDYYDDRQHSRRQDVRYESHRHRESSRRLRAQ